MGNLIRIAAIVVFAAIVVYVIFGIPSKDEDKEKEEETDELPEPQSIRATLKEKFCGTEHIGNPYISSTLHYESYGVIFSCEDGEERSFSVEPEVYGELTEGESGLLIYLDKTFYAFDTQTEDEL